MQFQVYQEARKGARPSNQDRIGYVYTNDCLMMIVCDGMGGHARGEVASQITVEAMAKAFRQSASPKIKDPATFLVKNILFAHDAILNFAKVQLMDETPRTTCVAAIIQDGKAWWANVGDSRLYMIRAGTIHRKTLDHSHVQNLIDSGAITAEQAMVHPDRNKIYNCLGQLVNPRIDVCSPITLTSGDRIILSSDGFWGPLVPEFVAHSLEQGHLNVNIPMLMDIAETLSGRECDNLSAVAMSWVNASGNAREVLRAPEAPENAVIDDSALELSIKLIKMASRSRPTFRDEN